MAPPARPSFIGCLPTMRRRPMTSSRRCRRSRSRQFGERQIGNDARTGLRAGIDDRLVAAAENAFHGLQIHALTGHVGRFLVLFVDLQEARGLALGFGDGLLAIGFGVLGDLGGAAARLRHDPVGVGLRFVLRALEIRARRLHVAEGVDDLRGRIDFLQLHLLHLDAGAVLVEGLLHQLLHRRLDVLARAGEDRLEGPVPDDLAHGGFGHRFHRSFGILDVEQIVADAGRLDFPQHREIDVDDVLVAGEHQAFLRHLAHRRAAAHVFHRAHADVDFVDAQRRRSQHGLDRIGQVIVQSRLHLAGELAEAKHHAELVGLDAKEAGKAPEHHGNERNQSDTAAAEIAGQEAAQPVLASAQKLLQIGRSRPASRLLRPRAPRSPGPRSPGATGLVVPRHQNVS